MFLTEKQINDYQTNGVIIVKDVFKNWITPLRKGFQKVLDNPSKHGRENVDDNNGRFFEDYCNWQRVKEFKDCIFNSPGAQIVAEATKSKSSQIFHEHIFIKEPGTHKETPWHQDMPYYCVDGNHTGSFWIPLDEVDRKNNLKLILGSHAWQKLIRPTKWSDNQSWYQDDSSFMDLPPLDEFEKNIIIPELNLGDAVLFNFKIVHGSTGNNTSKSRRAFSMRFICDDVKYIDRGGPTSPPFDGINLKTGDLMREDWFPKVFTS
ncbi:phytanoyl-CoA dioxygenase family protein [Candidatus Pelagibacter sp.]|nr:phytanoyl-CoA dioxygenase family protein [Candidatus Pelagibacter sp.]